MADAGVRQASADRTAALITADEMVFIDNPPNAVPIEHSTPGVDGELAPPRVAPLLAAPPSRGTIKSAKALKKVESLVGMSAVSHPGHQRAARHGAFRAFSAVASNGLPAHRRIFVFGPSVTGWRLFFLRRRQRLPVAAGHRSKAVGAV